jgi:hypothetical protein
VNEAASPATPACRYTRWPPTVAMEKLLPAEGCQLLPALPASNESW